MKNIHIWLPAHVKNVLSDKYVPRFPLHIVFSLVDHFEPFWNGAGKETALRRTLRWREKIGEVLGRFRDADDRTPRHTFFYPLEEYDPRILDIIKDICEQGHGDLEIHLHHDRDTADALSEKLMSFKEILHDRHGFLRKDAASGDILYGFIHGNWALDNSRKDGRWCGVNNELEVLRRTGCYADFTLPSAPSETQTRKVNSIYYATGDANRSKSHDDGIDAKAGEKTEGGLLIVQGPLALNWRKRKWGLLPRIENGEISSSYPCRPDRIGLWVAQHIHVEGRPEWLFVKVHTHGAQEDHAEYLLGRGLAETYACLGRNYNDGSRFILHYVTPWEMYNLIKAAEAGLQGNPGSFRRYLDSA